MSKYNKSLDKLIHLSLSEESVTRKELNKIIKPLQDLIDEKGYGRVQYKKVIDHLNEVAGTKFKHTAKGHKKYIKSRWNEGFTLDEFKQVIDYKTKEWKNDVDMAEYLRPATLFGNKMDLYLNESRLDNKGIDDNEQGNQFNHIKARD